MIVASNITLTKGLKATTLTIEAGSDIFEMNILLHDDMLARLSEQIMGIEQGVVNKPHGYEDGTIESKLLE